MKFLDIFAGIGGFRLGLERTGHEPVGWIEKDKFARKSYEAIHETDGEYTARDIREVEAGKLPEHELLTGGFPCQSFSIAGERGGFDDTRGTLFFEIMRLAKERQPEIIFLENVRGLFSADNGRVFGTILNTLGDMGYSVEWQMLNSKNFGVPQNRERVFIIGHLGGFGGRQVFSIGRKKEENIREKQQGEIIRELGYSNGDQGFMQSENVLGKDGISTTLQGAHEEKVLEGLNTTKNNDSYCIDKNYHKGTSPAQIKVEAARRTQVIDDMQIRKLTPKECWRLQGFSDWAFERAEEVNSDTQLYKQAGNAVTVNVIEAIGKRLNPHEGSGSE